MIERDHLRDPEFWEEVLLFGALLGILLLAAILAAPANAESSRGDGEAPGLLAASSPPAPSPSARPSLPPPPPPPAPVEPPEPQTKEEIEAEIRRSAEEHGIDVERTLAIARCESKLDPSRKNPTSGATGVYQFIDGGTGSVRGDIKRAHEWQARGRWSAWSQCENGGRGGGRSVPATEICISHAEWRDADAKPSLVDATWTVVAEIVTRGGCPYPPAPDWLADYDRKGWYIGCGLIGLETDQPRWACTPRPEMLLKRFDLTTQPSARLTA